VGLLDWVEATESLGDEDKDVDYTNDKGYYKNLKYDERDKRGRERESCRIERG
jgi:hypothetical protein